MSCYSNLTKIAFSIVSQRPSNNATWLHPGYTGCGLPTKEDKSAVEWLIKKDPSCVEAVIAFHVEAAKFPAFFFKTTEMPPLTW